jgi:acyl dehydratase
MTTVDGLELTIGTELPGLELPAISRATLALFAGASHDHNPVHIDLDVARAAGFEDVFAHGMLSMAYLGRLLTGWVTQDRAMSWTARFVAITPVHGAPTCRGRVTEIGDGVARVELTVQLADGTTTMTGEAVIAL